MASSLNEHVNELLKMSKQREEGETTTTTAHSERCKLHCLAPRSHLQGFILWLWVHPLQLLDEVAQVGDLHGDLSVILSLGLDYLLLHVLQPHQEETFLFILELVQLLEHQRDFTPLGSCLLLQGREMGRDENRRNPRPTKPG